MPTKPAPTSEESPRPKMVSARPVATWFAASVRVSTPKTKASAMPAPAPARMPRTPEPVLTATAKAATAPTIIMPSTPRFSTPDFSTTSSPSAAKSSGVAALMTVSRMGASISRPMALLRRLRAGGGRQRAPAQPVAHQEVGGQEEEQQQALEHAGDGPCKQTIDQYRIFARHFRLGPPVAYIVANTVV